MTKTALGGGQAAWPTYQEEKTPRPEDVRRNLGGPLPTLVLSCVVASMEEVEDVVQKSAVGNLHPNAVLLLCTRKHLDVHNRVREQVEAVVLGGVDKDLKRQKL